MPTIIGGIFIFFGFAFLGRGVGEIFRLFAISGESLNPLTKFIEAITKFIEALTKAPRWLSSTVIGVLLILLGAWIGGWLPQM